MKFKCKDCKTPIPERSTIKIENIQAVFCPICSGKCEALLDKADLSSFLDFNSFSDDEDKKEFKKDESPSLEKEENTDKNKKTKNSDDEIWEF